MASLLDKCIYGLVKLTSDESFAAIGHLASRPALPKSSPKRIAAKKVRESPPPRLSFSARLLRIHALGVRKHRNLLIGRHLPTSAFYSAVFQNALAGAL